jgi:hypothetical protein
MKSVRPFLILLFLLTSFAVPGWGQELQPVLPLSYGIGKLPMQKEAMRDPSFEARGIRDELGADQLNQEIENYKAQLAQSGSKNEKMELSRKIYEAAVIMSYHLEDVASGHFRSLADDKPKGGSLAAVRGDIIRYGKQYAAAVKNRKLKARALYNVIIAVNQGGTLSAQSVAQLTKIRADLPDALRARVDFCIASRSKSPKALAQLASSSRALSASGRIAAHLMMARSYAALKNSRYKQHLSQVSRLAAGRSAEEKTAVLGYAIGVWRLAEGKSRNWGTAPFSLTPFAASEQARAIIERSALRDVREGRKEVALKKYRSLSKAYNGTPAMFKLDERIVEITRKDAKTVQHMKSYIKVLTEMQGKYKQEQTFGDAYAAQTRAAHAGYQEKHRRVIRLLVDNALKSAASRDMRMFAILEAKKYVQSYADETEKYGVMLKVGKIYRLANEYAKAVQVYSELYESSQDDAQKKSVMLLMIEAQGKLAGWPADAPWAGVKKSAHPAARERLLTFYATLYELQQKKVDWPVIAHIGLLQISLSKGDEAFKLWSETIAQDSSSVHARRAAALMLVAHKKNEKWDELETLARLCLSKNLSPLSGTTALKARDFLGDALFYGGKKAYAAQDYQKAVDKLAEFTGGFRGDKRRDEGLFVLAHAYRGIENHVASLDTLKALVEEHPRSKFIKKGLLIGGEWSMQMAFDDYTIYFYEKFMAGFGTDKEAASVRTVLVEIYLARKDYGRVAAIYKGLMLNGKLDASSRAAAAILYLDIESRYGEKANVQWAARELTKLAGGSSLAMAKVYQTQARFDMRNASVSELKNLERKVAKLDMAEPEAAETLAMVRFMIAAAQAERTKKEVFNLELNDPIKSLDEYYGLFMQSKKEFEDVCAVGKTSYCAPAMAQMAELTTNTVKTLEEIKIPSTLDEETVNKFNAKKQSLIGSLGGIATAAEDRSIALVNEGGTVPDLASGIMWKTSEDWSMDNVNNESQTLFVQWTPAM